MFRFFALIRGAFVVYDITNRQSLEHARRWLTQLKAHAHPKIVLCLLGNKCDLEDRRQLATAEGAAFAADNGLFFFEVSAKDASNIEAAFSRMIIDIYNLVKKPDTAAANSASADSAAGNDGTSR